MLRFLTGFLFSISAAVAAQAADPFLPDLATLRDLKSNDADVRALAEKYPRLRTLRIGWPGMSDSAMKEVAKLTTIESIHIDNPSIYHGDGRVSQVTLTAEGWKALRGLPKLRELSVNDVKIDTAAMEEIGQLRQLTSLYLAHNGVTDTGAKHLAGMTQLTTLGLLQKGVTDESVPNLMKLQKVEVLLVDQTGLTNTALRQFATLPRLRAIDVRTEQVTADGIRALGVCKTLRQLTVFQRQVPADVLGTLREGNHHLSVGITDVGRYLEPLGGR